MSEVNTSQPPTLQKWYQVHEVEALTSLSRPTLYRLIALNKFPKGVRIGSRAVRWSEQSLLDWQASKQTAPDGQQ